MRDKTCRAFDTLSASDVYLTADVHTAVPSLTLPIQTAQIWEEALKIVLSIIIQVVGICH